MDWIGEHLWAAWLAIAVVLGTAEMFSLDLVLGMLAAGALAGMGTALLGGAFAFQLIVSVIVAIAMLGFIRPSVVKRLHSGPDLVLGHHNMIGKQAIVLRDITPTEAGQIKLGGEIWSARPYDDIGSIKSGETVDILEVRGATAYVHPRPALEA